MILELETERLFLHPLSHDDHDLCLEIGTDPDVMQFVGPVEKPDRIPALMHDLTRRCAGGCIGIWALVSRETGEKFGTVFLLPMAVEEPDTEWHLIDGSGLPDREIEIGYHLKKSAWGQGYATEAASRLIRFAFEESPLDEIVAVIDPENTASAHVLQKCGLAPAGPTRAFETTLPSFRITRHEWADRRLPSADPA